MLFSVLNASKITNCELLRCTEQNEQGIKFFVRNALDLNNFGHKALEMNFENSFTILGKT